MAVSAMLIHLLPKTPKYLVEGEGVAKDRIFQHIQKIRKCQKWPLIHVLIDKILKQGMFYHMRTRSSDVLEAGHPEAEESYTLTVYLGSVSR